MKDAACAEMGEVADEYPDVTKEAENDLTALLRAWVDKHVSMRCWTATGTAEEITS
jgi:hypothetical protein